MMKIKYIAVMMGVVLVTLSACTSDKEGQAEGRVPIKLTTAVQTLTRTATTATTGDTQLKTDQNVKVYVRNEDDTDFLTNANPMNMTVDGSGDLQLGGGQPMVYYPEDGTNVNIYAVSPSYTSEAEFTVASDQTDDANYAASDLTYSKKAEYSRQSDRQQLTFKHVMSKVVVNIENTYNSEDVTTVLLHANTKTAMEYPVDNTDGYTLTTATTLGTITVNANASAILPPQTLAAGTAFITFYVEGLGPMVYNLPAETTFQSGKKYVYNIKVTNLGITATTSVSDWGEKVANETVIGNKTVDIKKNPLWYVAEYNVNYTPATGTAWDNGAGTFSFAESDNEGYYFAWRDALKFFTTTGNLSTESPSSISDYTTGTGSRLPGWHLPVLKELQSIIPGDREVNIMGYVNSSSTTAYKKNYITSKFGYNNTTKSDGVIETSYFRWKSATELHAIRFIGTDYCSAWKYVISGSTLTISATLIERVEKDEDAIATGVGTRAEAWYNSHSWDGLEDNVIFWGNDDKKGAVQRSFYICSYNSSNTSPNANQNVARGYYWSATQDEFDNARSRSLSIENGIIKLSYHHKQYGFHVRLFRDN